MKYLSNSELDAIDKFEQEHLGCYTKNNINKSNVGFTIHQDWTGIGIATTVTCNCCGKTENVTDYNMW